MPIVRDAAASLKRRERHHAWVGWAMFRAAAIILYERIGLGGHGALRDSAEKGLARYDRRFSRLGHRLALARARRA